MRILTFTKKQKLQMDSLYSCITQPNPSFPRYKKYKRYFQLALLMMRCRFLFAVHVDIFHPIYEQPRFIVWSYGDDFTYLSGFTFTYSEIKKIFNIFNHGYNFKIEDSIKNYSIS